MQIGNININNYPVILAPMEDVTDPSFRHLCKFYGADLMFTEFISSEGLIRNAGKSTVKLRFEDDERPIGIQVFGHDEASMRRAVEIAESAGPDLIDINFGCPVKKVVSKGAGAAFLRDVPKMISLTAAVVTATRLPVTVKTRLGWDEQSKNIFEVAERLQDTGIKALTIHGRTRVQLYGGKADWTLIGEVKNNPKISIPVIGNGDIDSPEKAKKMIDQYGVDGIMVGRAAVGNPFLFREVRHYLSTGELLPPASFEERSAVCMEHLNLAVKYLGEKTAVFHLRRHYGRYFHGLHDIKPFRMKLVKASSPGEIWAILDELKNTTLGCGDRQKSRLSEANHPDDAML